MWMGSAAESSPKRQCPTPRRSARIALAGTKPIAKPRDVTASKANVSAKRAARAPTPSTGPAPTSRGRPDPTSVPKAKPPTPARTLDPPNTKRVKKRPPTAPILPPPSPAAAPAPLPAAVLPPAAIPAPPPAAVPPPPPSTARPPAPARAPPPSTSRPPARAAPRPQPPARPPPPTRAERYAARQQRDREYWRNNRPPPHFVRYPVARVDEPDQVQRIPPPEPPVQQQQQAEQQQQQLPVIPAPVAPPDVIEINDEDDDVINDDIAVFRFANPEVSDVESDDEEDAPARVVVPIEIDSDDSDASIGLDNLDVTLADVEEFEHSLSDVEEFEHSLSDVEEFQQSPVRVHEDEEEDSDEEDDHVNTPRLSPRLRGSPGNTPPAFDEEDDLNVTRTIYNVINLSPLPLRQQQGIADLPVRIDLPVPPPRCHVNIPRLSPRLRGSPGNTPPAFDEEDDLNVTRTIYNVINFSPLPQRQLQELVDLPVRIDLPVAPPRPPVARRLLGTPGNNPRNPFLVPRYHREPSPDDLEDVELLVRQRPTPVPRRPFARLQGNPGNNPPSPYQYASEDELEIVPQQDMPVFNVFPVRRFPELHVSPPYRRPPVDESDPDDTPPRARPVVIGRHPGRQDTPVRPPGPGIPRPTVKARRSISLPPAVRPPVPPRKSDPDVDFVSEMFPNVCRQYIARNMNIGRDALIGFILDNIDTDKVTKVARKRIFVQELSPVVVPAKKSKPEIQFDLETGFDLQALKSTEEGRARYAYMMDKLVEYCVEDDYKPTPPNGTVADSITLKLRYTRILPGFIDWLLSYGKKKPTGPKCSPVSLIIILELVSIPDCEELYARNVLNVDYVPRHCQRPHLKDSASTLGYSSNFWPSLEDWDNELRPGPYRDALDTVHEMMIRFLRGRVSFTCGVCFDDVHEYEGQTSCQTIDTKESEAHMFCNDCIGHHAEASAEEGRVLANGAGIPCMEPGCPRHFTIASISAFLKTPALKVLEKTIQQAVLISSGVEVERCKYCNFAAEMGSSKEVNKVFNCSECKAMFCRICLKDWEMHMGLRCDEIESKQDKARKELEEELSKAVLHNCPKCKLCFEKESGCNKMTCNCGTTQCYVCRATNIGYEHFCRHMRDPAQPGRCPVNCPQKCLLYQEVKKDMEANRIRIVERARIVLGEELVNRLE